MVCPVIEKLCPYSRIIELLLNFLVPQLLGTVCLQGSKEVIEESISSLEKGLSSP